MAELSDERLEALALEIDALATDPHVWKADCIRDVTTKLRRLAAEARQAALEEAAQLADANARERAAWMIEAGDGADGQEDIGGTVYAYKADKEIWEAHAARIRALHSKDTKS